MRWLFCFALLLAVPACGQSESSETAQATEGMHTARGEVKAIDGVRLDVDHEEIPGVMPAMQMPFFLGDASVVESLGIAVGDRVEFEFEMADGRHMIRSIRKL